MNPTLLPPTASIPVGAPADPLFDPDDDHWTAFRAEFGAEGEAAVRSILQNPGGDRDEVMDLYSRMAHTGKGGVNVPESHMQPIVPDAEVLQLSLHDLEQHFLIAGCGSVGPTKTGPVAKLLEDVLRSAKGGGQ